MFKYFKFARDFVLSPLAIFSITAVVLSYGLFWLVNMDNQNWSKFSMENNCRVVSQTSGETSLGLSASGQSIVVTSPGKTAWMCDDGVTYWR